jgi:glutamate--cysteine ligase
MFANSPRYAGEETGHRSYRAYCWRMLDVTRTGIVAAGGDPASEYASFALGAHDMMREDDAGAFRPFGDWIAAGDWNAAQWTRHLTTLFPEVRPRGHFEVRSCDAIDPAWYPALVVFLSGLVYDEEAAADAGAIVSESRGLLGRAGQHGLGDPAIAGDASDLAQLALDGAARLPANYLSPEHVDRARDVFALAHGVVHES